jgi:hypothetical protein
VVERRVRTDQRWNVGVRAGGGRSGSNTRVWRSLDIDKHDDVKPAERGHHDNNNEKDRRDGRSGEV